jgi:DNA-directed RNA polymerase specialized sigma24 family protein
LDEPDLELLRLRFLGELTFREIAEVTQRSSSAVKKSYYRLLARLKRQLEESNE